MPTITQLPAAATVGSTDLLVIVQGGTTKSATEQLFINGIQSGITISESQVTGLTTSLAGKLAVASNLSDLNNVTTARANLGIGPLNNGQLIIGNTGNPPTLANLSAGAGISIANSAGSITISGTGSGIGWTNVTGTTQAMSADNGYIPDNVGLVTLTLPLTAALGQAISIIGGNTGGWIIAQNASQLIRVGSVASTIGVGGSVASTNAYDSINLICTVPNTTWTVTGGVQGNLTIV